ncbi:MAG: TIGR03663 family protein [Armatimonas sp.]
MRLPLWGVALAIFALALALRLPKLNLRPFHADEAVHAEKFRQIWKEWDRRTYRYDPNEFHGPTIYYAALPSVLVSGRKTFATLEEADLRRTIAIAGAALSPLLLLFRRRIAPGALLWAGLFLALSPSLVFYSRYYIQEVFLVGFTLLFLAFASRGQPIAAGLAAGAMIATKETAVLSLGAAVVSWLAVRGGFKTLPWRAIGIGAGVAVVTAYIILSGLFTSPTAPLGYFQTFTPWLKRAGGGGEALHAHPWLYYLQSYFWQVTPTRPIWTEGFLALLGIAGAVFGRKSPEVRFLSIFTILLTVGYAAIPYKTPWCGLNFLAPLAILAGIGAYELLSRPKSKIIKALLALPLLAGSAHLGWLAYQTNYVYYTDRYNPYVYSPTLPDAQNLARRIERMASTHPDGEHITIKVISRDDYCWPLPWYLRRFEKVGYWSGTVPADPNAPLVLASPKFEEALTKKLPNHEIKGMHGLRLGVFYDLFVEKSLWESYRKRYGDSVDDEEY